jgi:carboxyl-terminal processing protease
MSKTIKIILVVLASMVLLSLGFFAGCNTSGGSSPVTSPSSPDVIASPNGTDSLTTAPAPSNISIPTPIPMLITPTPKPLLSPTPSSPSGTLGNTPAPTANFNLINQAWGILTRNYVEQSKVDGTALNQGAIAGMVQALNDPYSAYLTPEQYKLTQSNISGTFSGIGAQVNTNKENQIVIVAPIADSPAARAGIQNGDIILAVNGELTKGMNLTQVILLIRGPVGTAVSLTILHQNDSTPINISIIRAQITSPTVTSRMIGNIAYIQINSFGETTNSELNNALQSLDLKSSKGIILDLRDNPGGLVTTVVDVASHFIKSGVILTLRDNQGKTQTDSTRPNGVFTDLPMVVLVNQYSASGSEVLSGALQDYKRGEIAGTVTLGKGSYDSFFKLSDDSAIYLTVGRWITPSGREIEGKGITPDYILTQIGDDEINWAVNFLASKISKSTP